MQLFRYFVRQGMLAILSRAYSDFILSIYKFVFNNANRLERDALFSKCDYYISLFSNHIVKFNPLVLS